MLDLVNTSRDEVAPRRSTRDVLRWAFHPRTLRRRDGPRIRVSTCMGARRGRATKRQKASNDHKTERNRGSHHTFSRLWVLGVSESRHTSPCGRDDIGVPVRRIVASVGTPRCGISSTVAIRQETGGSPGTLPMSPARIRTWNGPDGPLPTRGSPRHVGPIRARAGRCRCRCPTGSVSPDGLR